ncbi:signal-regulatory protein beta-2-like [Leuresthes tenuis]|uniref:signal-regulatory protein beta-2-like n=1 Tax=Leuresthes tenuis TaxID=355514 RepID=UPI003B50998F
MRVILYILLLLQAGWCTFDENFVTKTVGVGENATLSCNRNKSRGSATLFWIRTVTGTMPEILGKGFNFDYDHVNRIGRFTTKQEPGTLVLQITKTKLSDTAFYYCLKSQQRDITFYKGIFLQIKGPEPDVTAVVQGSPSDAIYAGDSVTLPCSVLSDSEKKTCPEEHRVFWFRVASDESHHRLIYGQSNSDGECDVKSPDAQSLQSCAYSFFKDNLTSTDAGTYYCAVAACGRIVFGNGTKLDIEVVSTHDAEKTVMFLSLLCAALAVSLIVTAFLVCAVRKTSCNCCQGKTNSLHFHKLLFPKS